MAVCHNKTQLKESLKMVYEGMSGYTLKQLEETELLDSMTDEQIRRLAWLLHWRIEDINKQLTMRGMR